MRKWKMACTITTINTTVNSKKACSKFSWVALSGSNEKIDYLKTSMYYIKWIYRELNLWL